jgi:hypothetical protein
MVRTATASYKGHRYPVEIINHCVWLYFRFPLSFREVEELMLVRGVAITSAVLSALSKHFPTLDGLRYNCRFAGTACMALFLPAATAMPGYPLSPNLSPIRVWPGASPEPLSGSATT